MSKHISMWTAGGLNGTTWMQIKVIIPFVLVGIVLSLILSKQLTLLSLSDEVAVGLGQKTIQIKAVLFFSIVILAGAAVSIAGNLVFVGLIILHIVRKIIRNDYHVVYYHWFYFFITS